jgi:hypothetical protein
MGPHISVARQMLRALERATTPPRTSSRQPLTVREDGARRNVPVRCSKSLQISEGCVWLKEAHPLFGVEV